MTRPSRRSRVSNRSGSSATATFSTPTGPVAAIAAMNGQHLDSTRFPSLARWTPTKACELFRRPPDAAYRKALHVGESVDAFKVTKIEASTVDLERAGKSLSVRVGQQLRRPEGADWTLVGEDVVRREAQARADAMKQADPNAPVVIPPDASEALRRLMEARNKQLKP